MKKELSTKEITLYALYILGGWQRRIHTEDIALKCFELAPTKFSWTKFPQFPDLAPTRFALEGSKKKQNDVLVEGESEKKKSVITLGGWRLTPIGVKWIEANKKRIENVLGTHKQVGSRLDMSRKLKTLMESKAFIKFLNDKDNAQISHAEFAQSLICTVNTEKRVLNERIEQLYTTAEKLQKQNVKDYLNYCRVSFKNLLT